MWTVANLSFLGWVFARARLLDHLRSLYAKPGLSSFLDGLLDGSALRTLVTGLSVGSLTLNNNMLNGDGLLHGLDGVTLRNSNLVPNSSCMSLFLRTCNVCRV